MIHSYQIAQVLAQLNLDPLPKTEPTQATIDIILNLVFGIMGVVTFLIIVIGGFKYITSNGDPGGMAKAKNTVIYALIGLVVILSAYTIVRFVLKGVA